MNGIDFDLCGVTLTALPSGALWHRAGGTLCVSDLHFGKSERIARRSGLMLPPYDTAATLERLDADLSATGAATVICLGDSFDDLAAAEGLAEDARLWIARLQAGRRWIWIEGNHDPGPVELGGSHRDSYRTGALLFRHIAAEVPPENAEVSGHYHPKLALAGMGGAARPCFLLDRCRVILPAYGAYTGGMAALAPPLSDLIGAEGFAILTGRRAVLVPLAPLRAGAGRRRGPAPAHRFG